MGFQTLDPIKLRVMIQSIFNNIFNHYIYCFQLLKDKQVSPSIFDSDFQVRCFLLGTLNTYSIALLGIWGKWNHVVGCGCSQIIF